MTWIWIVSAFIAGSIFGLGIMCCFIVASEEDKRLEKLNTQDADGK